MAKDREARSALLNLLFPHRAGKLELRVGNKAAPAATVEEVENLISEYPNGAISLDLQN